jgi:Zn-dependent metalloprotease
LNYRFKMLLITVAGLVISACNGNGLDKFEHQRMALGAEGIDALVSLPISVISASDLMAARLRDLNAIQQAGVEAILKTASEEEATDLYMLEKAKGQPLDAIGIGFDRRGNVRYLSGGPLGLLVEASGATTMERAQFFLNTWPELFQSNKIHVEITSTEAEDSSTVQFRQLIDGLPVFNSDIVLRVDPATLRIRSYAGSIVPDALIPEVTPVLTLSDAQVLASNWGLSSNIDDIELGIADPQLISEGEGDPELAWRIPVSGEDGLPYTSFISAHSGNEIARIKQFNNVEEKNIYYISTKQCGPTDCVCSQLSSGTTEEVCELGTDIWEYYDNIFDRDGWDDEHSSQYHDISLLSDNYSPLNGASWSLGLHAISFGPDAVCTDVMGHEFAHAIISDEVFLPNNYINEGLADIMGEFFSQNRGTTDWAMFTGSPFCNFGLRNLASPTSWTDPYDSQEYPDHWSNCWLGGTSPAHFNATILGKSAHLLGRPSTEGSITHWGRSVQGVGPGTAEQIYYHAITDVLTASADLTEVRMSAIDAAEAEFPGNNTVIQAAKTSMDAVGIWTPDYYSGITSDHTVRSTSFYVNSNQRRYSLWKLNGYTSLKLRYNTCEPCVANCRNSVTTTVGYTTVSPGLADVGGKLHFVWKDNSSKTIKWRYVDSSGAMSTTTSLPYLTESGVDAARVGTKLFVFWKTVGSGEKTLAGAYWYNNQWTSLGALPTGTVSAYGPGVTGDPSGNLWLSYVKSVGGVNRVVIRKRSSRGTWSSEVVLFDSLASQQPTAEYYRGRVHFAAESTAGLTDDIGYASCEMPCSSGTDYTRWVIQDGGGGYNVSLSAGNENDSPLFMLYQPVTISTDTYCRNKNSE